MKAVRAMKTSEQQMLTMTGAASPLRRVTFTAVIISLQLQACACGLLGTALAALSAGQLTERPLVDGSLAHPAIGYFSRPTTDPVAELKRWIEDGTARLTFDEGTGYLRSALEALHVPIESQMLVFSKTSLQRERISPQNPRALYFNDDIYIGWIPGAPLMEVSSAAFACESLGPTAAKSRAG